MVRELRFDPIRRQAYRDATRRCTGASVAVRAAADTRDTVERVHAMHREHCPVYRSICRAIEITTAYELVSD